MVVMEEDDITLMLMASINILNNSAWRQYKMYALLFPLEMIMAECLLTFFGSDNDLAPNRQQAII